MCLGIGCFLYCKPHVSEIPSAHVQEMQEMRDTYAIQARISPPNNGGGYNFQFWDSFSILPLQWLELQYMVEALCCFPRGVYTQESLVFLSLEEDQKHQITAISPLHTIFLFVWWFSRLGGRFWNLSLFGGSTFDLQLMTGPFPLRTWDRWVHFWENSILQWISREWHHSWWKGRELWRKYS